MSDDPSDEHDKPVDGCTEEEHKEEDEDFEEYRRYKAFKAKCKLVIITLGIFGFGLDIVIFPILSILSAKYSWGVQFPDIQLDTISALLSGLF